MTNYVNDGLGNTEKNELKVTNALSIPPTSVLDG